MWWKGSKSIEDFAREAQEAFSKASHCPEIHPISVEQKIINSLTEEELRRASNEVFPRTNRRLREMNVHELVEILHSWRRNKYSNTNKQSYPYCLTNGDSCNYTTDVSINGKFIEALWDTGSQASLIRKDQVEEDWLQEECQIVVRGLGGKTTSNLRLIEA